MKTITTAVMFLLYMNTIMSQVSISVATGVMKGKTYDEVRAELVSTTPYIIYKGVYEWRSHTSAAIQANVNYLFKSGVNLSLGINTSTDRIQPWFYQLNAGYQLGGMKCDGQDDRIWAFGVMPYAGYGYRMQNKDSYGTEGSTYTAGAQLQLWHWFEAYKPENSMRMVFYLSGEHSYKNTTVSLGFRGFFENKRAK
jgi:hypothetical protein